MSTIEDRECLACGEVTEHWVDREATFCLSCGSRDSSEPIGDCQIGECPNESTHVVVYNPVGRERWSEYYCEAHAELAADEAREDPDGELFYGPAVLDTEK